MQLELKALAYDVFNAIEEIETFLKDVPTFELYAADLKTRRAIERPTQACCKPTAIMCNIL